MQDKKEVARKANVKTSMELNQYLKELRKKNRYTQEYVAFKLHICRQTYSHYETGRIRPSAEMLCRIAEFYEIPAEGLLDAALVVYRDSYPEREKEQYLQAQNLSEFLEDKRNYERLKSLDMAERHLIYYYENLKIPEQIAAMTMMKVFFDHCKDKK